MQGCSKAVSHVCKSIIANEILEEDKKLQIANSTHWNSQLKMFISILAVDHKKLGHLQYAQKITLYEKNVLKDIIKILTSFEEATIFPKFRIIHLLGMWFHTYKVTSSFKVQHTFSQYPQDLPNKTND